MNIHVTTENSEPRKDSDMPMDGNNAHQIDANITTNDPDKLTIPISIQTMNCHGYKASFDYILNRLNDTDVMCLTETWLKPSEHNFMQYVLMPM